MAHDTPSPLSAEEHRELGDELRKTQERLHALYEMLSGVYGPDHYTAFSFQRVNTSLQELRRDLETQAADDCPDDTGRFYI